MPGRVVVQWDKDDCADLGIIKVDLLGLGMMAALEDAITIVNGGTVDKLKLQDTVLVTTENVNDVNPVDFYGPNVK